MWNLSSILDNLDGAVKEAVDDTRGPQLSATEIRKARRSDGCDGGRRSPFEEGTNVGEEVTHHDTYPGAPLSSSSTATSSSSSSYNDHGGAGSTVSTTAHVHMSSSGEVSRSGSGSGRRSPFENQGMPISPAPKAEGRVTVKTRPKVSRTSMNANTNANANTDAAVPKPNATGTGSAAQVQRGALSVPLSVPAKHRHQSQGQGPGGSGVPAAVALGSGTSAFGALSHTQAQAQVNAPGYKQMEGGAAAAAAAARAPLAQCNGAGNSNTPGPAKPPITSSAPAPAMLMSPSVVNFNAVAETRKDLEIERLNGECLELENEVAGLKKEVESAWRTYKTSQENHAEREDSAQEEVVQLKAHMKAAAEQFDQVRERVKAAEHAKEAAKEEADQAGDRIATLERRIAALEGDLTAAQTGSLQGVQTIQERLRTAELSADTLREEQAQWVRKSQVRQSSLEESNSELLGSLADKERDLQRVKALLEQSGSDSSTAAKRELDGLRQQYEETLAALEGERIKTETLDRRLNKMDCDYKASAIGLADERARAQESLDALEMQLADAQERLRAMPAAPVTTGADADNRRQLDNQVQSLASQLFKKQTTCQELIAERSGLKAKIGALLTRATAAESRLSQLEDLEGGDGDMDGDGDYGYDDGESSFRAADPYQNHRGVTSSSSSGMAGMGDTAFPSSSASGTPSKQLHLSVGGRLEKRRPTRSTKMISEFEKFGVHGNHSVAKAIDGIDSWTLVSGRFLRSYPLLRLGFVLYLVMLHLWVLVVLAFHTAAMEEEDLVEGLDAQIADPHQVGPH